MPPADSLIGQVLGHYRVLDRLGAGGMGVVYRAEDVRLHRRVALKLLPEGDASRPHAVERLYREACAASALNHPNICTIHDIGTDSGRSFVVMELLEGCTLRERLADGRLPLQQALDVARQIADALEAAHVKNIVHRDIKPANIFITTRDVVKVLDFGLAKVVADADDPHSTRTTREELTNSGMALGTVSYMSTEQLQGDPLDVRTDIFSFGLVLYEMLTGRQAFSGNTPAMVFDAILHRAPVPPSRLNPDVPPALDALTERALQKNRERRYATMSALLVDLRRLIAVVGGVSVTASALATTERSARRAPARKSDSGKSRALGALAVLPFANVANDHELEYLSDGITESIINKLSSLRGLRVVPRSTVFRYKAAPDLGVVAADLKVRTIVSGRVLQRAGHLVVNVELVDVKKQSQMWGHQYNRTVDDLLEVQEDIAAEISRSLELKLTGDDEKKLVRRDTHDSVAYQSYLKGRFYWNKRTIDGLLQANEHFQAAIDQDPQYALAYVGLADTFNIVGYYGGRRPSVVYPRAKAAAARALDIDPTMAEPHASLGFSRLFYDRDWAGAEQAFLEAIRINPTYASAHQWYAWLLMVTRRWDEMMRAMQRAHDLDPLSLVINDHLGYALELVGRTDEAMQQLQATLDLDPQFALTHQRLGGLYISQGRPEEAMAAFEMAVRLSSGRMGLGALGFAAATCGRRAQAEEVLTRLRDRSREQFVSPLEFAYVHAALGDVDACFEALDHAVAERISDLVRLDLLRWPMPIRDDPRFAALLSVLGLRASPA